jgi:hypothetical protein
VGSQQGSSEAFPTQKRKAPSVPHPQTRYVRLGCHLKPRDRHFCWSRADLWAWLDLNQRPHPYQGSAPDPVSPGSRLRPARTTYRWRPLETVRFRWDVDQTWTKPGRPGGPTDWIRRRVGVPRYGAHSSRGVLWLSNGNRFLVVKELVGVGRPVGKRLASLSARLARLAAAYLTSESGEGRRFRPASLGVRRSATGGGHAGRSFLRRSGSATRHANSTARRIGVPIARGTILLAAATAED